MQKQQYKRLYNLAFALIAVCSFVFVFRLTKSLITTNVIEVWQDQHAKMFDNQRRYIYNQLVKAGKREEADHFIRDQQANTLGLFMTDDESGQPFGVKANALDGRIRFCEENLGVLSTVTALLGYVAAYFIFWYAGFYAVRYVKGQPNQEVSSQSKQS